MHSLLQYLISGLVVGSIYALVALGYTMVYGILGLINFAHGEVVMFGTLTTISLVEMLGAHLPFSGAPLVILAVAATLPISALLGYGIERFAYRPLRHAPRLAPLITAIGVSIVLKTVAVFIWGREFKPFPAVLRLRIFEILGADITNIQITIIATTLLCMAGLFLMIEKTRLGRAMRATAERPDIATLMGINTHRIISITFVLGSMLGAIAGVMACTNDVSANSEMGSLLGLKAFSAAVLGGIGNVNGAVVGGIVLGIVEQLGAGYIGSEYQDIFAFMVLIGVLVLRPSGLLGERLAERA